MIEKLDQYHISNNQDVVNHNVIAKINEIIDFLNDTYLMKVKDGQYGSITDSCEFATTKLNDICDSIAACISLKSNIKCPHCGESYYTEMGSMSTCVYYPPVWKDGVNVNPDRNKTTTHCKCLNCGKEFDI